MCGHCGGSGEKGAHWDTIASDQFNKNERTMEQLITEIRARLDWIGVASIDGPKDNCEGGEVERNSVRLLDYGCGNGMISRALGPYITQAVGIDPSPNRVHEYNMWASTRSSTSKMTAVVGNLLDPADPSPTTFEGEEFNGFDLAIMGLGFHHFENPVFAATRVAARLKKGGVLLILDFLVDERSGPPADGHRHDHGLGQSHGHGNGGGTVAKTRKRRGFDEEQIKLVFESADVGMDFGFEVIAKGAVFKTSKHSMAKDVFMARGTRA